MFFYICGGIELFYKETDLKYKLFNPYPTDSYYDLSLIEQILNNRGVEGRSAWLKTE